MLVRLLQKGGLSNRLEEIVFLAHHVLSWDVYPDFTPLAWKESWEGGAAVRATIRNRSAEPDYPIAFY